MADAGAVRTRLLAAGARPGFAGMLIDQRYDRDGRLLAVDEVLRLRVFRGPDGHDKAVLGWKGTTTVTAEGYKARRELEYGIESAGARPEELLEALGYGVIQRIERYVEYYRLGETDVRLEWYPRMDVLIEVEGDEAGIEVALRATGLPRGAFTPEPLPLFAERFAARTGRPAALALAELAGEVPTWERR